MRVLVAGAILGATLSIASAADLPLKALSIPASKFSCGTTQTCIGPYAGIDFSGLNGNFTSFLPGASGAVSGGDMTLGVHGGFEYWNGTYFAAVEVGARYSMAQNLNAVGGLDQNRFTFLETVKLGANLAGVLGLAQSGAPANPSASGPVASSGFSVPANLLSMLTSAYIELGAAQRFSKTGTVTGAGVQLLLASNWTADIDYKHITWGSNTMAGPAVSLDTEDIATAGLSYHF